MADPLQEPALETPPGFISQFPTIHSGEQAWFSVCATLCAVVPGTLLLLRLYTKLRVVRKVDLTDYMTSSSFLFLISMLICGRMCLAEGAGVHQWNVPMHNYMRVLYWDYVGQIIYAPTMLQVKTAILLQYLRLFAPQKIINPFMWYTARIIIVVTGIFYIMNTFITIFTCSPREAIWNPLITDFQCLDKNTMVLFTCLFNIVSDIIILTLPARAVWKLRIPVRKKIGIVLLFAIGLLACIANAMIIVYVTRLGGVNADVSYNIAWQGFWAFAEISLGITVTCTFSLPKFIEARGTKLRGVFSSLTRPSTSLMPESDLSSTNGDQDIERYPSYEGVHNQCSERAPTRNPGGLHR